MSDIVNFQTFTGVSDVGGFVMRKLVKISVLIASLLFFISMPTMVIHAEEALKGSSDIIINEYFFPDDSFRNFIYCCNHYNEY